MKISAIVAMSANSVIGKDNRLPWKLPEDLKRFKEITWGHTLVMGRKTFESIGRVLPGRKSIVLTRQNDLQIPGVEIAQSWDQVVQSYRKKIDEIFVMGGAEIYQLTFPQLDRIYLTSIHQEIEGDAFFPDIPWNDFKEVSREERTEPMKFSFLVLDRR